jgi:muramoyltetrapeptide carboxypeptidase LdcA involved in peptidoglycan recycling
VSFYGGQLLNQVATPGFLHEYTERYLRRAFFDASMGRVEPADEWSDDVVDWAEPDYESIEPAYEPAPGWRWERGEGVVESRVWGGCLMVLVWQLAVGRYFLDPGALDGAMLALETSEELPTSDDVRRFLTCLGERGLLGRFDAVLVGRPQTRHGLSAWATTSAAATAGSSARRSSGRSTGTIPRPEWCSTSTSGTPIRPSRYQSAAGRAWTSSARR